MNRVTDWLLGSPTLSPADTGVLFDFERPLPPWAWALVALAACVLGYLAYRRTQGPIGARLALGTLRAFLLVLLGVLISGPRFIKPNQTEEKDWVLVLVDRSASLSIADRDASADRRTTREEQLRSILSQAQPVLSALAADRTVVYLGFDASAYDLPLVPDAQGRPALPALADPTGRRTDINRALDQALRRAAARPIAGVVLLSDGRSVEPPSRALLRRLQAEKIPVFTVALGSPKNAPDLAVARVDAPRLAFSKDAVPVQVELSRSAAGAAPDALASESIVELVDASTGAVLDTQTVRWDAPAAATGADPGSSPPIDQSRRLTLTARSTVAGQGKWSVRVRPANPADADMSPDNNTSDFSIDLIDRPLRVAYFDGYPRWEYRFLKNLLVREPSITSSILLLAPGKRYIQEGSVTLDALPASPEDWSKFDVIILGDLWPGVFTPEQLAQLRDRVAVGGAGLIWIGGEGSTPGAWRTTPLNDLLPFVISDALASSAASVTGGGLERFASPITLSPTPAADRLGVLRLSESPTPQPSGIPSFWPRELSDPATGWSRLYFAQVIEPATVKPAVETLAIATPLQGEPSPAVLSMRFGAGRALYVATDEIWRWRYARGERLPERFWIQLVRMLGREAVARSGQPAALELTPERAEIDQPVRIQLTLLDQALIESAPPSLSVTLTKTAESDNRPVDPSASPPIQLQLLPETRASDAAGPARAKGIRTYAATFVPTDSGRYKVLATDPVLATSASSELSARLEVWQADDELRRPQTDHALLSTLSSATDARTLTPAELPQLPKLLPNRRVILSGEPDVHTLWDTPLALLSIILLLTLEWIGRRLLRLA